MSGTRAAIVRHLRANPGSAPTGIAEALGISYETVKKTCQRMSADGQLAADTGGRYRLPDEPGTVAPASVPGVPGVPEPLLNCEDQPAIQGHSAGLVSPVSLDRPGSTRPARRRSERASPRYANCSHDGRSGGDLAR